MSGLTIQNYSKTLCAKLFFGNQNGVLDFERVEEFIKESPSKELTSRQMTDYILLLFLVVFGFSDLLLGDNIIPSYPYNTIKQIKTISFLDSASRREWNKIPYAFKYKFFLLIFSNLELESKNTSTFGGFNFKNISKEFSLQNTFGDSDLRENL